MRTKLSQEIKSVEELQEYLSRISGHATQRARNVNQVILALAGAVVLFKDPGTHLEILTRHGNRKNVLFLTINGTRYVFSYNHQQQTVDIKQDSLQGRVVGSFTNNTPYAQILQVFKGFETYNLFSNNERL